MTTAVLPSRTLPALTDAPSPDRPQRFTRLVRVELRKMLDTRAGLAVVLASIGVVLVAAGWLALDGTGPRWETFSAALSVAGTLLPVIAILGMTSEWTQRTALTTFTAAPRRGRVIAAKVLASLLVSAGVYLAMVGVLALGTVVAGWLTGDPISFENFEITVRAFAIMAFAQAFMAMGFGAVVGHSALAIVMFFLAPSIVPMVGHQLLGDNASWFNVFETYGRLAGDEPWSDLWPTVVTLLIWVVLPFTVGVVRSLRREVK